MEHTFISTTEMEVEEEAFEEKFFYLFASKASK